MRSSVLDRPPERQIRARRVHPERRRRRCPNGHVGCPRRGSRPNGRRSDKRVGDGCQPSNGYPCTTSASSPENGQGIEPWVRQPCSTPFSRSTRGRCRPQALVSMAEVKAAAEAAPPPATRWPRCAPGIAVIAEVKRSQSVTRTARADRRPGRVGAGVPEGRRAGDQRAHRGAQVQRLCRATWTRSCGRPSRCCARTCCAAVSDPRGAPTAPTCSC